MLRLWKQKAPSGKHLERELRDKGYWPGAETYSIRLWWNDDDERVIEERIQNNENLHRN